MFERKDYIKKDLLTGTNALSIFSVFSISSRENLFVRMPIRESKILFQYLTFPFNRLILTLSIIISFQNIGIAQCDYFDQNTVDTSICLGSTLNTNFLDHLSQPTEIYNTAIHLPDGSGMNYATPMEISGYNTVFSSNNTLRLCVNIEHSYLGDLEMALVSPNGTMINVFNSYSGVGLFVGGFGGGGTYLGGANDVSSNIGICEEYCFSETSNSLPAWVNGFSTVPASGPSLGQMVQPGNYHPEESFDAFLGDPIDGQWTLIARDNIGADNGWICSWSLSFNYFDVDGHWTPSSWVTDPNSLHTEISPTSSQNYMFIADTANSNCYDTLFLNVTVDSFNIAYSPIVGSNSAIVFSTTDYSTAFDSSADYYWELENGAISSGQGTNQISVQWFDDPYGVVHLYASNGCSSFTDSMVVSLGYSGINSMDERSINIAPNPTSENFQIFSDIPISSVQIFDITGSLITSLPISSFSETISVNISHLPSGTYFIGIVTSENAYITRKIVKHEE